MNVSQQRKTGSILGYLYTLSQAIVSIVYIPILLNIIGDSEYGLYQILSSVIAYFAAMEAPLSASLLKYYSLYKENGNQEKMENTLAIGRRIFALFSIVLVLLSIPVAFLFQKIYASSLSSNELSESLLMFGIMIINLIINLISFTYVASITANESFVFLKISGLVSLLLQPVLVVLVIKRIPYAFVIVLITTILSFVLYLTRKFYAVKKIGVVIKYHGYDKELLLGIIKLSSSVFFVAVADQIFWKTDQLILGALYDTKVVSVYSIGSQINTMYISVACVIGGMILPMVTRIANDQKCDEKLSDLFTRIGRYQSYLVFLILTGVVLFGKEFILIIAGADYLETYYVALLLMIPYSVDLIQTCACTVMQVKDKYYLRSISLLTVALINIILTIELAKKYGMIGAAFATTISIIIVNVILNIIYKKCINLNVWMFWRKNIPIVLMASIICGIGYFITLIPISNVYCSFAVHVVIYSILYVTLMFTFVMNKSEKQIILSIIKKTLNLKDR